MTRQKLVVIGNGMAGCRAIEEILKKDAGAFEITVFGAEPRVNYNRIMLSPVLAGEKAFEDIIINDEAWYEANGITLYSGVPVTRIDRAARRVHAGDVSVSYDRLILATGSDPFRLPLPGIDLDGVVTFRDLDDVEKMVAAADAGGEAVVIGGGLLGLEAAYGLARRGMKATVVHLMDVLMERQLDSAAGYLLTQALIERGVETVLSAQSEEILGENGKVSGLRLKDGRVLPASLLVMAVGIKPNAALARDCGLAVNRGIVVDDHMRTDDPAIYAVGECAEHRGVAYGLVAPIWEMCRTLAASILGDDGAAYEGSVLSTRLKVSGVDVFSAGQFAGGEGCEDVVFRDAGRGVYKRLVLKDGKLAGAVMFGDAVDGNWYFDLMRAGTDVSEMRETLVFGQAITEGLRGLDPSSAVAAMADTAEICGCNGVCKGAITTAIGAGVQTLDGVRAVTKASASCGSCTPLVEQLLKLTLGDSFKSDTGPKAVCKCTDHGHAVVRKRIVAEGLKSMPAVMQALEWKTPDGCPTCRPALNYYLLCAWPAEYTDDKQSRFVNERVHANIQKDGTYSVVPRMWGGVTTPAELRAIADVAEKFNIPTVKCTGGQRIDLLGVRKDDLPAVWADLNAAGMVSGHAYGKSLRTVKTCVGSEWCRFGTQDSTGLGIRLEKFMWGSWTPAKLKLGVSGCPRNCAEATCKDIGVICVDSGYEIHIGGAAGLHIQGTEVLTRVATEDEALWVICAVTQMYREDAFYLERIYKWMARVGLDAIRAAVEDPDSRKALYDRFTFSQRFYRIDPWAERVAGRHAEEFSPMSRSMELAHS
jgi:nitrite reductase (NADH) large subunit